MYRKEKRIPTLLALIILIFGVGGAVYLDQSTQQLQSSAASTAKPLDIHFTNISDNSFVVSWITEQPAIASVVIKDGTSSIIYIDDLDNDNIPRPRSTHYVTIKNLKENTSYSVKIVSGDLKCSNNDLCPTLTQKTAPKLPILSALPPARGNLITQADLPAQGTIVYLTIGKSYPLSGRVDTSGLWVIPLANLLTQDLLSRLEIADNDIIQITAQLSPSETTQALIDVKSIRENLTIPAMQIGKTYNFVNLLSKKGLFANSTNQRILGTQIQVNKIPIISTAEISKNTIDILFPRQDQDVTTDNRPRLRGTGIPGKQLLITINSTPQTGRVTVTSDGAWEFRPSRPLSPGTHHISIQSYDETGNLVTLSKTFIVLKSGESVLGEATTSATLTPTIYLSVTPFTTPTITPSYVSPTLSTTLPPTITLTPTIWITPTNGFTTAMPSVKPPPTGITQPTLVILATSISLILIGVKFLFSP